MKTPFQRFEEALAREANAKPTRTHHRRARKAPQAPSAMTLHLEPGVTAAASLTAALEGETTFSVLKRWIVEATTTDDPPRKHPTVALVLKLAIGPEGIPADLANEAEATARAEGITPAAFVLRCIREGIHREHPRR